MKKELNFSAPGAAGFTLVEILIAMVIMGIVGLAIFSIQIQSIRTAARSASMTEAGALASQQLELFQNIPMAALLDFGDKAEEDSGWARVIEERDIHGIRVYRIFWNIFENTPEAGMLSVEMEIQWEDQGQRRFIPFNFLKTQML
ncbi:prepilin-type N-terminal cleavage/methylation domain-containing protein [Desulfobotulus alkaliphilus]|uniref:Prepilin-type N-terminal cleavage/methylation domain-containing protein n=1 Tax=Desulfobotulus alkaliphilus TaxID=622671 RepID=A0A562RRW9_9BACT|nr:type II secretion system protein [Desulfobotulus alkaliphilus]TWI71818.1 prepilin-type N-terminal cleavage/methylation domain-containing protein [Desulfobotulus alkaliphilus]